MVLRSKDETFEIFMIFAKKIQVKLSGKIIGIGSDHGKKNLNARIDQFYTKNRIIHNFSAPTTTQQNKVVEIKNKTWWTLQVPC